MFSIFNWIPRKRLCLQQCTSWNGYHNKFNNP